MAIKINNTTVIDDSQNLCNVGTITANNFIGDGSQLTNAGPVPILKPTNTNPVNNSNNQPFTPTLCGSTYRSLYGKTHTCSCFEVSVDSGFSNTEFTCEIAGACTSIVVPSDCLSFETQHFFRLRYEDEDGQCSAFSDATCFTTGAPLTILGSSACGGFYTGTICAANTCYYLIVSPNVSGCAACVWKTTITATGAASDFDGYGNTYDHLANVTHPAGNWTATRSIGGFSDWYLPSVDEGLEMHLARGCLPAGEGYASAQNGNYWTSTEQNITRACIRRIGGNGGANQSRKDISTRLRAIRREPF